jgi:hypothetical protein
MNRKRREFRFSLHCPQAVPKYAWGQTKGARIRSKQKQKQQKKKKKKQKQKQKQKQMQMQMQK